MSVVTRRVPPGPTGYPLVGVFPKARRDPLGFLIECARRHGDVTSMRFGRRQVYLLSHPDHVKHVLQDDTRAYAKGTPATRVRGLFGDSLTVVDGDRCLQGLVSIGDLNAHQATSQEQTIYLLHEYLYGRV